MKVVHYTNKEGWTLHPIRITSYSSNKPQGALWTSPDSEYGWSEWCEDNMFKTEEHRVDLEINLERAFIIETKADMLNMPWSKYQPEIDFLWLCDYIEMAKEYDCIWLTAIGEYNTRLFFPGPNLYGWDCETVCILNERCVTSYEVADIRSTFHSNDRRRKKMAD